jgi:hypothetical protein
MKSASQEMAAWIELWIPADAFTRLITEWPCRDATARDAMLVFMARDAEAPDTPCGCTNCYRLFSYADVADFCDDGETPVCPCCGLDSVVISTPDMIVDAHCLFAMRKTYH